MPPTYTTGTHADRWDDSGLPKSVREYLAVGAEEGNRDNALFKAACQMRDHSYPIAEAERLLVSRAVADGLDAAYAQKKIKRIYDSPQRPPAAAAVPPSSGASAREQNTPSSQPDVTGVPLPTPITDGFRVFIKTVFEDGERVSIGQGRRDAKGEISPDYGDTRLRRMWLKAGPPQNLLGVFVHINPMQYRGSKNIHVSAYRHTLVEFDRDKNGQPVSKQIQYAALLSSGFPISTVADSGNKSLHGLVRVDAADKVQYLERVEIVYAHFRQYDFFDDSNKAESKYCRLPGCERQLFNAQGDSAGIARQELLAVNVGPAGWDEWPKAHQLNTEDLQQLNEKRRSYYDRIEQPMPEPMAKEAYYGKAGQIVDIITRAGTEACPESILIQFLIAFGNISGRKPYRHQGGTHHLNEFGVLVGESGTGCKGTSWNTLYDLLELLDPAWMDNRVQGGFPTGEGIIDKVRDPSTRLTRGGKSVTDPGEKDRRLLIMEEEFGQILIVAKRDGNTISTALRNAWDAKRVLSISGKNDPRKATGSHISLIGHITPKELRSLLSEIDSTNGFANRISWIAVAGIGEVAIPPRINWQRDHPELIRVLREIITNFQNRPAGEMDWSPEARAIWNQYYREQRKRRLGGLIGPIVKRSLAHVLRYTMIYAVLDNSNLLSPEHLRAAIALIQYSERSAQWCFSQKTGNKEADKILWELDRALDGLSRTEIFKICRNRSATEISMALAILRDNQQADFCIKQPDRGTKPIECWYSARHRRNS